MEEGNASSGGRGRNKRYWTPEEDKALILALYEMSIDNHWKCENGFRNGYMSKLEELIGKAIPGCGLKATPHDSRLKSLVKKYRAIMQMLGTSGFKWDEEKKTIAVEKSVYDEYCKVHPNCRNLYGVPFPYLNEMESIYGKDYATGKSAEGFVEAIEDLEKEVTVPLSLDTSDDDVAADGSSAPPIKKVKIERSMKRGRKSVETPKGSQSSEFTKFEKFVDNMNVHLSAMANAMKRAEERETEIHDREMELAKMNDKVLDELLMLEGITTDEALTAAEGLLAQPHKLTLFFKCSSALRTRYVKGLLGESGGGRS